MNLRKLGERIRSQREKRHLRQVDLASALQISAQAVSKWERGENAPDLSVILELSRLLGVSVEWLLGGMAADSDTFPATVFCTSLQGFAQKAAALHPRDLAAWANGIYYSMTESVLRFDGVPIKYVGDGFLGFFSGPDHEVRAIRAARWARQSVDRGELVICLNSGEIYLGTIGHPDYSAADILGEAVNTAFLAMNWVAEQCPHHVGVTHRTAEALPKEVALDAVGEVAVLGVDEPIRIFDLPPETNETQ
jgi:class 3 adenylate cyclase